VFHRTTRTGKIYKEEIKKIETKIVEEAQVDMTEIGMEVGDTGTEVKITTNESMKHRRDSRMRTNRAEMNDGRFRLNGKTDTSKNVGKLKRLRSAS